MQIAIVVSRFNEDITEALLEGALARLGERGVKAEQITTLWVPGAVELPLVAQQFARRGDVSAVICLGAVIRGDTDHYDYVCQQVSYGCQRVALTHNIPIVFGILTTENTIQAHARIGGSHGHKGRDSADAALDTLEALRQVDHRQ